MNLDFYESWRDIRKNARNKLTNEQAKNFHDDKIPYVAVFSQINIPNYVIKIYFNDSGYFCSVLHLNKALDVKRSESYEILDGQLFMRNVKERFFDGREVSLVTYLYEPDGRYRKNFFIDGLETDEVEYGQCDVSSHFREMIQFGNYDSILPQEAKNGLNG